MSAAAVVIGVFMVINLVIALMVSARRHNRRPKDRRLLHRRLRWRMWRRLT